MKIKMLVSMAGATFTWAPGDVVEVDADEAGRLIAAEFAAPVRGVAVEQAVKPAVAETADATPSKSRKAKR